MYMFRENARRILTQTALAFGRLFGGTAIFLLVVGGVAAGWEVPPEPGSGSTSNRFTPEADESEAKAERIPPTTETFTIEQLQSMAMVCNPTIAQAMDEIRALRGRWLQSGLRPNPAVGWLAEEMGNDGRAGRQGIEFSQEFITAGKLDLNRAVVQQQINSARSELAGQQRRVLNDVQTAAYRVLGDHQRIEILRELQRINEEVVGACNSLLDAQEIALTDLLKAQIELETTTMRLRVENREYNGTRRALAGIVGRSDLTDFHVEGSLAEDLPVLDWETSLARLFAASPELHEARAAVSQARCEVARQRAGRVSDVEVGGAVAYNTASEYTEVTLGVGMPVKLFDRNQGNIAEAEARLIAARREVDRLRLAMYHRLADGYREYQVAREQAETYKDSILPKAKRSLTLTAEGFRRGEQTYLELLNAQQTYFYANLDFIESLEGVWVTATEIEGLLLSGGLDSVLDDE